MREKELYELIKSDSLNQVELAKENIEHFREMIYNAKTGKQRENLRREKEKWEGLKNRSERKLWFLEHSTPETFLDLKYKRTGDYVFSKLRKQVSD